MTGGGVITALVWGGFGAAVGAGIVCEIVCWAEERQWQRDQERLRAEHRLQGVQSADCVQRVRPATYRGRVQPTVAEFERWLNMPAAPDPARKDGGS